MDKLILETPFVKGILAGFIGRALKKKLGYNIDIQIYNINAISENGKIRLRADMAAETTTEEFSKIIKKAGL